MVYNRFQGQGFFLSCEWALQVSEGGAQAHLGGQIRDNTKTHF